MWSIGSFPSLQQLVKMVIEIEAGIKLSMVQTYRFLYSTGDFLRNSDCYTNVVKDTCIYDYPQLLLPQVNASLNVPQNAFRSLRNVPRTLIFV